jgi:acyl-coenzyme A thioesterase PaaI-like protein
MSNFPSLKLLFDPDFAAFIIQHKLLNRKTIAIPPSFDEVLLAPGQNTELHHGFVNCENNPCGLHAQFFKDKQSGGVSCRWTNSKKEFEGYPGLIHGGVGSALLDELMAYAILEKTGCFGITLQVKYQWTKPLNVEESISGKADVIKRIGRYLKVNSQLFKENAKLAATGQGLFFLPTVDQFKKITKSADIPQEFMPYFYRETPP